MKQASVSRSHVIEVLTHVIGWGIVLGLPFLMMSRESQRFTWMDYLLRGISFPLALLVIFYVNYIVLIPKYMLAGQIRKFLLMNVLAVACIAMGMHVWQEYAVLCHLDNDGMPIPQGPKIPQWISLTRDAFPLVLTIGLSVAIKMSIRWAQIENARREAEKNRTEAELKNLRNQLNPHFLLNTLNNIYALIAFDADKAQAAVQELSRLLRHVLYENQQDFVPLGKEMDFIRNYIELMRIRLSSNVRVETCFDVRPDSSTEIAPLIFISLIENAFKHGISPTEPSFIRIYFSETPETVCCDMANSYHPKKQADKSGRGIGLEQVKKRLELTYPGRYDWQKGVSSDGKEYRSLLIIHKMSVS